MSNRIKRSTKGNSRSKEKPKLITAWIPIPLYNAMMKAVKTLGLDRSKFVRLAIIERVTVLQKGAE